MGFSVKRLRPSGPSPSRGLRLMATRTWAHPLYQLEKIGVNRLYQPTARTSVATET